jgi:hypothetical protein
VKQINYSPTRENRPPQPRATDEITCFSAGPSSSW